MINNIQLSHHEVLNEFLLLQWSDDSESIIPLKSMRDNCPCANCSGETDVFGNIYKGPPQSMNSESYKLKGIHPVGHYAIRPFWYDGHSDGIYPFDFLIQLCSTLDS